VLAAASRGYALCAPWGAFRQLRALGMRRQLKRLLASPAAILVFAIPCTVILTRDPRIVTGVYQIWTPALSKLAYYAIYFFAGALWHKYRTSLADLGRRHAALLAASILLFVPALVLIREHKLAELHGLARWVLGATIVLFAWTTSLGLIGLFLHRIAGRKPTLSYLGEASYWVYLTHFPVVGLAQVALFGAAIPVEAKFVVSFLAAMATTLLSYQVAVRGTAIGQFLNGHRHGRPRAAVAQRQFSIEAATPRDLRRAA